LKVTAVACWTSRPLAKGEPFYEFAYPRPSSENGTKPYRERDQLSDPILSAVGRGQL
jgi:hypothetical protein